MKTSPESTTTHISYIIEFCSKKLKLLQTSSESKTILQKSYLQQFIRILYSTEGKNPITSDNNDISIKPIRDITREEKRQQRLRFHPTPQTNPEAEYKAKLNQQTYLHMQYLKTKPQARLSILILIKAYLSTDIT